MPGQFREKLDVSKHDCLPCAHEQRSFSIFARVVLFFCEVLSCMAPWFLLSVSTSFFVDCDVNEKKAKSRNSLALNRALHVGWDVMWMLVRVGCDQVISNSDPVFNYSHLITAP